MDRTVDLMESLSFNLTSNPSRAKELHESAEKLIQIARREEFKTGERSKLYDKALCAMLCVTPAVRKWIKADVNWISHNELDERQLYDFGLTLRTIVENASTNKLLKCWEHENGVANLGAMLIPNVDLLAVLLQSNMSNYDIVRHIQRLRHLSDERNSQILDQVFIRALGEPRCGEVRVGIADVLASDILQTAVGSYCRDSDHLVDAFVALCDDGKYRNTQAHHVIDKLWHKLSCVACNDRDHPSGPWGDFHAKVQLLEELADHGVDMRDSLLLASVSDDLEYALGKKLKRFTVRKAISRLR